MTAVEVDRVYAFPGPHQQVSAPAVRAQSVGQRVEVGAKVYSIEGLS